MIETSILTIPKAISWWINHTIQESEFQVLARCKKSPCHRQMCALKSSQYLFKTFQGSSNNCSAKLFCGSWAARLKPLTPGLLGSRQEGLPRTRGSSLDLDCVVPAVGSFVRHIVSCYFDLHIHVGHTSTFLRGRKTQKWFSAVDFFLLYSSQKEQKQPNAHRNNIQQELQRCCSFLNPRMPELTFSLSTWAFVATFHRWTVQIQRWHTMALRLLKACSLTWCCFRC